MLRYRLAHLTAVCVFVPVAAVVVAPILLPPHWQDDPEEQDSFDLISSILPSSPGSLTSISILKD